MQVTFTRTGERRYSVKAATPQGRLMQMPVAPGFDAHLPHDVAHFLVERHFRLGRAIFAQLAAGGDAATFIELPRDLRKARKLRARSDRLMRDNGGDVDRSERLAGLLMAAFYASRGERWAHAEHLGAAGPPASELGERADALLTETAAVAAAWHALPPGGALALEWPDELRADHPASRRTAHA